METKAIMIDIETLSLKPNAYVTQIGFCAAILETRQYLLAPRNILTSYSPNDQKNSDIDFETICWWMKQDKAVSDNIFVGDNSARRHRFSIFEDFQIMVTGLGAGTTIWAMPAMFDLPVLTHYFGGKPWDYRCERCLMTLAATLDPHGDMKPPVNVLAHDAAADAGWQMEYLMNLWAILPSKTAKPA